MAKRKAAASKSAPIQTLTELAKLVDRDTGTVSRWTKRDDWGFARQPPWPRSAVPKILRWVADTLLTREAASSQPTEDGGDPEDLPALRKEKLKKEIRKLHAQADIAETALARERGKLLDAAEVESEWASIGVVIRNSIQNLPSQLVPLALSHGMPIETAAAYRQQIEESVAAILRRLSRDGTEVSNTSETEVLSEPDAAGAVDPVGVG